MAQQPKEVEVPTGKALEGFRQQRDEWRDRKKATAAYNKATTYPETKDVVNPQNPEKKSQRRRNQILGFPSCRRHRTTR